MSRNIIAGLQELLGAEQELRRVWGLASVAVVNRTFTPEARARFDDLRLRLYRDEQTVYEALLAFLPSALHELIPAPTTVPAAPSETPSSAEGTLSGAGLGALPPQAWAAIILVALAEIAALGYVAVRLLELTQQTIVSIYQVRANTARYAMELAMSERRFLACIRGGTSAAECAAAVPIPHAPLEDVADPPINSLALFAGVAGLVAGAGGVWVVATKSGKRFRKSLRRRRW